jgi:hypothetical protein
LKPNTFDKDGNLLANNEFRIVSRVTQTDSVYPSQTTLVSSDTGYSGIKISNFQTRQFEPQHYMVSKSSLTSVLSVDDAYNGAYLRELAPTISFKLGVMDGDFFCEPVIFRIAIKYTQEPLFRYPPVFDTAELRRGLVPLVNISRVREMEDVPNIMRGMSTFAFLRSVNDLDSGVTMPSNAFFNPLLNFVKALRTNYRPP